MDPTPRLCNGSRSNKNVRVHSALPFPYRRNSWPNATISQKWQCTLDYLHGTLTGREEPCDIV